MDREADFSAWTKIRQFAQSFSAQQVMPVSVSGYVLIGLFIGSPHAFMIPPPPSRAAQKGFAWGSMNNTRNRITFQSPFAKPRHFLSLSQKSRKNKTALKKTPGTVGL